MKTKLLSCCIVFMATLQLFAVNDFTVNGIGYVKLGGDSVEVGNNKDKTGSVSIPATVNHNSKTYRVVAIGEYAFENSNITSISIPSSVKKLGYAAFSYCSNLHTLTIPNSVTTLRERLFMGSGISSLTIPNSVISIEASAFSGCKNLTNISIPNTVTSIGSLLFEGSSITSPIYNDHTFIALPTSFSGSYSVPNGISTIAGGAFYNCKNLTEVIFPESIHKICSGACMSCTSISSVTIPVNVDTIENCVFGYCVDLTDVYVLPLNPPVMEYTDVFPSAVTVHLSCGANLSAYQRDEYHNGWKSFNLEYPAPNFTLTLYSNEAQGTINTLHALECNNDTAVIYAQANTGYQFTSWSDGNTDNPRTLIMTQDKTLHANFTESLYTFTAITEDATKGIVIANNGSYQYGTELTITATPLGNYQFDHWEIEEERTILPTRIVAKFLVPDSWADPYAWIWETGEYGHWEKLSRVNGWLIYNTDADNMNILLVSNGQSFNGQTEDIKLTESACYIIEENEGGSNPSVRKSYDCITEEDYAPRKDTITTTVSDNPYTLTLTTNTKVTAVFTTTQFQYCKRCSNGYIYSEYTNYAGEGNSGCQAVDAGTTITATILPNNGYIFQQWSDGNTDNPRIFTITQDTTMEAICIRDQSVLTLNVSNDEAGRVFGAGTYDKNTSVQIFAIPNSGYDFVGWSDRNNMNPRYLYLDEAEKILTANFEITSAAQYVVNVSAQNPALGSAAATNYVRLDAAPFDGCTFVRWSDGNTDNPRYMELNADIELQAIFEGIPSNVESTSSATPNSVHKIIVNDQIFILRGEKVYTLQGQEVK